MTAAPALTDADLRRLRLQAECYALAGHAAVEVDGPTLLALLAELADCRDRQRRLVDAMGHAGVTGAAFAECLDGLVSIRGEMGGA